MNIIYLSHGMPRSGSTFMFQLITSVLAVRNEAAGVRLSNVDILRGAGVSFSGDGYCHSAVEVEEAISKLSSAGGEAGCSAVIKTHAPVSEKIIGAIQRKEIFANTSFRDPCQMALSILAISRRERMSDGGGRFDNYDTVDDLLEGLDWNVRTGLAWMEIDNVLKVHFDLLISRPKDVISAIADQIGFSISDADVEHIADWYFGNKVARIGEYNDGSFNTSISEADLEMMHRRFSEFYSKLPRLVDSSSADILGNSR